MRSYGITNVAPYATAPPVGVAGDEYWNTTEKRLYASDGSAWNAVGAGIGGANVPVGTVLAWGGAGAAPTGYLVCDGSAVSRTTYAALFTAIGTAHGPGDGTTTFNLPDIRARYIGGYLAGDPQFGTVGRSVGANTHTHVLSEPNVLAAIAFTSGSGAGTLRQRRATASPGWTSTLANTTSIAFGGDSTLIGGGTVVTGISDPNTAVPVATTVMQFVIKAVADPTTIPSTSGLPIFADAASRDAAIPSPVDGMSCVLLTPPGTQVYRASVPGWFPPWNEPWGELCWAGISAPSTPIVGPGGVPGMQASFASQPGRRIRLSVWGVVAVSAAGGEGRLELMLDGARACMGSVNIVTANRGVPLPLSVVRDWTDNVVHQLSVNMSRSAGTGNVQVVGDPTGGPAYITAEDIGPTRP